MNRALILAVMLLAALRPLHAQWDVQPSPTTASLRGIHSIGGGIAWASGTEGTVLRTVDGGARWQPCAIPPGAEHLDFRGVQALDENGALIMSSGPGPLSRLYKTTDACRTWKLVLTNPDADGFWDAIQLYPDFKRSIDRFEGFLIGDPVNGHFVLYTTIDSGDTWQPWGPAKAYRPAKAAAGESLFAASNSAMIAPGVNGPVAFATGGKGGPRLFLAQPHSPFDAATWWAFTTIKLPMPSGPESGAFSLASRKGTNAHPFADLMIVGGDYKNPETGAAAFVPWRAPVRDRFPSPVIATQHPPHGYRSSVAYDAAAKTWIAVGPTGTDVSTDDGRTWIALHPNPALHEPAGADRDWNAISLPFVVGPHGRIGKLRPEALHP
jgi:hypothetical protein